MKVEINNKFEIGEEVLENYLANEDEIMEGKVIDIIYHVRKEKIIYHIEINEYDFFHTTTREEKYLRKKNK